MKNSFEKIIVAFSLIVFAAAVGYNVSFAAVSVSVSATSETQTGNNVSVSVNISGDNISAYTLYISYDASVLQFVSGNGAIVGGGGGSVVISGSGDGSISLSFMALNPGTSNISASGEVFDINGNELQTSYGASSVTVKGGGSDTQATQTKPTESTSLATTGSTEASTEKTTESNITESPQDEEQKSSNSALYSLEVDQWELSPAFSGDNTSYTLKVDEGTKSISILAYPADAKAKVSIIGADNLRPGENEVIIKVTAEDGSTRSYKLNVIAGEAVEDISIELEGVKYSFVTDKNELASAGVRIPDGYESAEISYIGFDIPAYRLVDTELSIACLKSADNTYSWFIYDSENEDFYPYHELSYNDNRYIILRFPTELALLDKYMLTSVEINGELINAYEFNDAGGDYYILYAFKINGAEGLYLYDDYEKSMVRGDFLASITDAVLVATAVDATPEDATPSTPIGNDDNQKALARKYVSIFLAIIMASALVLIVTIAVMAIRLRQLTREARTEEAAAGAEHTEKSAFYEAAETGLVEEALYEETGETGLAEDTVYEETSEPVFVEEILYEETGETGLAEDTVYEETSETVFAEEALYDEAAEAGLAEEAVYEENESDGMTMDEALAVFWGDDTYKPDKKKNKKEKHKLFGRRKDKAEADYESEPVAEDNEVADKAAEVEEPIESVANTEDSAFVEKSAEPITYAEDSAFVEKSAEPIAYAEDSAFVEKSAEPITYAEDSAFVEKSAEPITYAEDSAFMDKAAEPATQTKKKSSFILFNADLD